MKLAILILVLTLVAGCGGEDGEGVAVAPTDTYDLRETMPEDHLEAFDRGEVRVVEGQLWTGQVELRSDGCAVLVVEPVTEPYSLPILVSGTFAELTEESYALVFPEGTKLGPDGNNISFGEPQANPGQVQADALVVVSGWVDGGKLTIRRPPTLGGTDGPNFSSVTGGEDALERCGSNPLFVLQVCELPEGNCYGV